MSICNVSIVCRLALYTYMLAYVKIYKHVHILIYVYIY